jgi:hypothetical protein
MQSLLFANTIQHNATQQVKKLDFLVQRSELLVTGQTKEEGERVVRKMRAMRVAGTSRAVKGSRDNWMDLWGAAKY